MIQLEPTHSILSRLQTVPGRRVSQTQLKPVLSTQAVAQGPSTGGHLLTGAGALCNPLHTAKGSHPKPHGRSGPPFQVRPFPFQGTAASPEFKRSCSSSSLLRQLVTNRVTVKLVAQDLVTSCRGGSWKSYWIYFGCRKGGCHQRRGCQRRCLLGPLRRCFEILVPLGAIQL